MVPSAIRTSEPGSFARQTLAVRVPAILDNARKLVGGVSREIDAELDTLRRELVSGVLRPLHEAAPDRAIWDAACTPHVGRSWLDLPWFFAESFFYRRLLEATGYFAPGPLAGVDPFARSKSSELGERTPEHCARVFASLPLSADERLHALLFASLWGNRADLSYDVASQLGSTSGVASDVIADDSHAVVEFILARRLRTVIVLLDNAGSELAMDLGLVDALLHDSGVERVRLHAKNQPMFVSDALVSDVDATLNAFDRMPDSISPALGARLRRARERGRLEISAPPFYSTSGMYTELPEPLSSELAGADLCIVKGDANYRRLCSDAHWPPTTPFISVVETFPAPLVALRTLKAELIVGLPPGEAQRLHAEDPEWLVNGRRAVIQARLSR